MEVFIKSERKFIIIAEKFKKEVLFMKDNNKVLLSNLKTYQKLNRLYKVQEALAENEILRKAKANQKESINTSVNPIN